MHGNTFQLCYKELQILSDRKKSLSERKEKFFWSNQSSAFKPLIKSKRQYLRNTKLFCKLLPVCITYVSLFYTMYP